ncbi:Gfo/Idh/MocA family protein [Rhodohalobacter mucosus]|uniref:Gfo/Idh/MocA family oxidoreductase n=1 Tax=Rhodohalobacter mucosus TaxID=2079485 RepID=A0A316TXC2_9BACT|nr:Gfo/Idh/MocA family oxidoreductase [Rhodohalobacter mucosus]PWN07254.1 gfo/Idh/MocA family oxidoreductase [Rhodohalobacter mucosus]
MSDILRIGFIGSGFIAKFLAVAMKQVRHCELSAISQRSGSSELAAYARENGLGDPVLTNSTHELCTHCDAIAILSPNYTRVAIMEEISDAVQNGSELTGVICEKPLGRTLDEARKMTGLAHNSGLLTAYFENQLHMNSINHALSQLRPQQKAMGPFTLARSTEEHAGPHSAWFWDPTKQGGGVLSDMGCHSIAICRHILTPENKSPLFLEPIAMQCDTSLLKWGQPQYRKQLKEKYGVDYAETPAEDFATGIVTFRNPETGQIVKGQFTDSWMYDKQGLRLSMDGLGPGYAIEVNSLISPSEIFIGDEAAESVADAELALEKSTASRGLLAVQPNEADLYGYTTELRDAVDSFLNGRDAMLNWEYGVEVTFLVQAAYLAAERKETIDLTDTQVKKDLESYRSLISQGRGNEVLVPNGRTDEWRNR